MEANYYGTVGRAHGDMMGCIFRGNAGTYSVQNRRSYDAWGLVRQGAGSGDPKGRYCANLGHKVDDESGLIYMRARYYEPGSGRTVSQNPGQQGNNCCAYCGSDPIQGVDKSGTDFEIAGNCWTVGFFVLSIAFACALFNANGAALVLADIAMTCFAAGLAETSSLYESHGHGAAVWLGILSEVVYMAATRTILKGVKAGEDTIASIAVSAVGAYSMVCLAALACIDADAEE